MKVKELVSYLLLPFWLPFALFFFVLLNLAEWKREHEQTEKY